MLAGLAVALHQGRMLGALLQKADHRAEDRQGCRLLSRCQHVGEASAETQKDDAYLRVTAVFTC